MKAKTVLLTLGILLAALIVAKAVAFVWFKASHKAERQEQFNR